jgi:hypothetical protein
MKYTVSNKRLEKEVGNFRRLRTEPAAESVGLLPQARTYEHG